MMENNKLIAYLEQSLDHIDRGLTQEGRDMLFDVIQHLKEEGRLSENV